MNLQQACIGCVGMTHLGIHYAAAFADKGFKTICYDQDHALISDLSQHVLPVKEAGLQQLIQRNQQRLCYTTQLDALRQCDVVFIAYDVPTDHQGGSDLTVIQQLIDTVSVIVHDEASIVLLSQVPPGFTQKIDFDKKRLFYQAETLIFGRAVERACFPERYIVGLNDAAAALPPVYAALLESFNCPILKMRYASAELAKISINLFLVSSVTTTNTIAELAEKIGADWQEIVPALRLDKRIGEYAYLNPGLGIAGGNLERDLATVIALADQNKTNASVVQSWVLHSQYCRDWVWRNMTRIIFNQIECPRICILGIAYKPGTHSVKNSQSLALLEQLKNYSVTIHDPQIEIAHRGYKKTIEEALAAADVAIIMTPWDVYKKLDIAFFEKYMHGDHIIDPYRALDKQFEVSHFNYSAMGCSPVITQEALCSNI